MVIAMSDSVRYLAVCRDCGWESTSASYRDRPYPQRRNAKRALAGHLGQTGCDSTLTEVVHDD